MPNISRPPNPANGLTLGQQRGFAKLQKEYRQGHYQRRLGGSEAVGSWPEMSLVSTTDRQHQVDNLPHRRIRVK